MSDKKLIEKLLHGNKKALRVFYKTYSSRLHSFIQRKVSEPKDAEEILQDTLIDGLEALRDFRGNSSLYTYLCAIAKYKTIDYYRKKKLKNIVFSKIPAAEEIFAILATPENQLDKKITKKKVHETLDLLRPRYRRVLRLKYLNGFSVKQVAKKMQISFKAAESILFRARREFALVYEKQKTIQKSRGET